MHQKYFSCLKGEVTTRRGLNYREQQGLKLDEKDAGDTKIIDLLQQGK